MMNPIYMITDPHACLPVVEQALAAARGGAWAIQLRDKSATDDQLADLVRALLPALHEMGAKLIVNDRVDVALRCKADGLHIGQSDGDATAIRQRIGPDIILGLSVETERQARNVPPGINYIGAGPVRATPTKPDHAAPIGFDGLARIAALVKVPTFAIGGIMQADLPHVRSAGAFGISVVSAISRADDAEAATRALLAGWRQP